MTLNVFDPHFQFETTRASTLSETNTLLMDLCSFFLPGFGAMGLETGVSEKAPSAVMAALGGLETPRVGVKEIGALFLAIGTTLNSLCASVISLGIVGFEAGGTHVTTVQGRTQGDW